MGRKGLYASSELTSGRRAQRLQREHNVSHAAELQDRLGAERYDALVWAPNVDAAIAFAATLQRQVGAVDPVISPAPFSAPRWPQSAYLGFWETVIQTRAKAVYFNEGWEYSTGCIYEFSVAAEIGLPTFDNAGELLSRDQAGESIARAIRDIEASGLATTDVRASLDRIARRASS